MEIVCLKSRDICIGKGIDIKDEQYPCIPELTIKGPSLFTSYINLHIAKPDDKAY